MLSLALSDSSVLLSHLISCFILDNGVILKILEDGSKAFIISETHLCNGSAPVHSMKLDSEKIFLCFRGGIQNIADGLTKVCHRKSGGRFTREVKQSLTAPLRIQHSVHTGIPFYLSCPVDSNHATYKWEHNQTSIPCKQTQSECLLLIPAMTNGMYGDYKCTSHELDYTRTVREYRVEWRMENGAFKLRAQNWLMATFVTSAFYLRSL
ncbi:hypothetical protein cypCar_00008260 [Cyprinus carpio]|nr:hypothetical protein cypCar_00008260 [Cyprinus carpio]